MTSPGYEVQSVASPNSPGPTWAASLTPKTGGRHDPLQTLTSGRKRDVKGGSLQAHICVISSTADVAKVLEAFRGAAAFQEVVSWSYAYRLMGKSSGSAPAPRMLENVQEDEQLLPDSPTAAAGGGPSMLEVTEDGIDEGAGLQGVKSLIRSALHHSAQRSAA
eukprot:TRINITY_DN13825_c0_g2_i2.p1 TRINITY_DN13825_c0_g2~~TRINITY_DN13825_c0_g2_i2.p1  ORF type:complete len:163 (-),score=26.17 TRINITY_DN13825_c0_g2_i2:34-522(-)